LGHYSFSVFFSFLFWQILLLKTLWWNDRKELLLQRVTCGVLSWTRTSSIIHQKLEPPFPEYASLSSFEPLMHFLCGCPNSQVCVNVVALIYVYKYFLSSEISLWSCLILIIAFAWCQIAKLAFIGMGYVILENNSELWKTRFYCVH